MTGSSVNLTSAVGLIVAVVLLALTVGVVAVFIIVVVANRAEPDATARRPLVVYLFGMSFFTLFAALIASLGMSTPIGPGVLTSFGSTLALTSVPSALASTSRRAQAVGLRAGLDDVGVERQPVDDGGDEPGIADDATPL